MSRMHKWIVFILSFFIRFYFNQYVNCEQMIFLCNTGELLWNNKKKNCFWFSINRLDWLLSTQLHLFTPNSNSVFFFIHLNQQNLQIDFITILKSLHSKISIGISCKNKVIKCQQPLNCHFKCNNNLASIGKLSIIFLIRCHFNYSIETLKHINFQLDLMRWKKRVQKQK